MQLFRRTSFQSRFVSLTYANYCQRIIKVYVTCDLYTLTLGKVSREVSLVLDDVREPLVGAEAHVEVGEPLRHGPPQPALPREGDELLVVRPLSLALLRCVYV